MEVKINYQTTEIGVLPSDWNATALGRVALIQRGASPRPIDSPIWFDENSSTGWLRISDVSKAKKYLLETVQNLSDKGIANSQFVEKNNLVMSICATVGRPIITKKNVCIHDGFVVFNSLTVNKEYLYYVLSGIEKNWSKHGQTGSQMNLNTGLINSTKVPLPSTEKEQSAIATALSDVDSLITQLEKLITKKRQIKQGAMQTLLNHFDENGALKKGWTLESLGGLSHTFTKQTGFDYSAYIKPALVQRDEEGVIPFIQNKDFCGPDVNYDTDYFIPYRVAKDFPRILLKEKCLLISISGCVGNVGLYIGNKTAFLGGAIAVAKFKDTDKVDWVMYYLQSKLGQDSLLINVKAGSHQNLILDDLRKIEIPFPPSEERDDIVKLCFDLDSETSSLEEKLEKVKKLKQGMMQSLLTGQIRLVDPAPKNEQ